MNRNKRQNRYSDEFKQGAVGQVLDRGYTRKEVAERLGVAPRTLERWVKEAQITPSRREEEADLVKEARLLRAELARVKEERDILKKATAYFAKETM